MSMNKRHWARAASAPNRAKIFTPSPRLRRTSGNNADLPAVARSAEEGRAVVRGPLLNVTARDAGVDSPEFDGLGDAGRQVSWPTKGNSRLKFRLELSIAAVMPLLIPIAIGAALGARLKKDPKVKAVSKYTNGTKVKAYTKKAK